MLVLLPFAFLFGLSQAQRPDNASLCDYYAGSLYGDSGNASQAKLIKSIVSLAFGGPSGLQNVTDSALTGILNPGTFDNNPIDLLPWFNGSKDSTNLNNAPIATNWLDGGGIKPLSDFLTGATPDLVLNNATNEYRLFNHFFVAFSHTFGCSDPVPSASTGGTTGGTQQLSLAYVHKYMDLNFTDLGHFIDQLGKAAIYYGFSTQDADTFTSNLNSQYNVRCAPPITTNPAQGPQLLSLCQDPSCPLAAPNPDCAPYADLQPGGYSASSSSTGASSSTAPPSSSTSPPTSTTSPPSSSTSSSSQTSPANKSSGGSGNGLSGGAIAGIAIGSAVVVLMAVALGLWWFKKGRGSNKPSDQYTPSSAYASPAYTDPHASYVSPMNQAHMNVQSWQSAPPHAEVPLAEMDSPHYGNSPEMATTSNQWEGIYPPSNPSQR